MKKIELSGKKFGYLTVIYEYDKRNKQIRWYCQCDCGNRPIVFGNNLKRRKNISCGCISREKSSERIKLIAKTHGLTNSNSYRSWIALKQRCFRKKHPAYERYSKLYFDDRWLKFEDFYLDMGDRPDGKTLDRIDNSKGYYKENCRWATYKEQGRNRGDNRIIEFAGEKMTMMEWSEKLGIKYSTLSMRINHSKWSIEKSLTTI